MIKTYKEIFILLLLSHVIAEFYIPKLKTNQENYRMIDIFYSTFIYGMVVYIFAKCICFSLKFYYFIILCLIRFIIDRTDYYPTKILNVKLNMSFPIKQFVYILLYGIISYCMIRDSNLYQYNTFLEDYFKTIGYPLQNSLELLLQILLIHKPANIIIVYIIQFYKPNNKEDNDTKKAGRMIGTLERIIMLFFLLLNQYSSIGLVLTAKSIARYNKISEDKEFAEYYLLGTLLSTISVLLVTIL